MNRAASPPRHRSVYAWRAKLGLIVPPTNTVNEAEWSRLVPEGVTFHTMRMKLHADTVSPAGKAELWRDLVATMADLAPARVDVIAYACTAGSMINPPEQLPEAMHRQSGIASLTTAAAIVRALRALRVKRVAVATPYHDALNEHERHFLAECGIKITRIRGLGIGATGPADYVRIAQTPLEVVADLARDVMSEAAQAVLLSCTDFPTLPLIPVLEAEFGVPVVSSNTATLWAALRDAGIGDRVNGAGQLFAEAGADDAQGPPGLERPKV